MHVKKEVEAAVANEVEVGTVDPAAEAGTEDEGEDLAARTGEGGMLSITQYSQQ